MKENVIVVAATLSKLAISQNPYIGKGHQTKKQNSVALSPRANYTD
jgi:hypothetical protein